MAIKIIRDLRTAFGQARDQGARPTCLAFAVSDSHAAIRANRVPLSCEYAYYHAQRRTARPPDAGATLPSMLEALREDGQPVETDWPYLASLPTDLRSWMPPRKIGPVYRRDSESQGNEFKKLISNLETDRPALIIMMLSNAFFTPDAMGVVVASSSERPDPSLRHALVAVAHGTFEGEQSILVRNSWGLGWGIQGHAWLTKSYLAPRLLEVVVLKEEVNVLASTSAA